MSIDAMRRLGWPAAMIALAGCVASSGATLIGPALAVIQPAGEVPPGPGAPSAPAQARLAAQREAALRDATRDAIDAALRAPGDLRLSRRALAMAREVAGMQGATIEAVGIAPVLDQLIATQPCPGLADVATTLIAFGDHARGGDAYVRQIRTCSVEVAVAAVVPLRGLKRCNDAIAGLRDAWPRVEIGGRDVWTTVFDAVAICSSVSNLRRNLGFAPHEAVADYFALREAREADERDRKHAEQAEQNARHAFNRCESECNGAATTCNTGCQGGALCRQDCMAVARSCHADCARGDQP